MISVDDALELVLTHSSRLGTEQVPLGEALDRVLVEAAVSRDTIPAAPTSAMDGYAVRSADLPGRRATLALVAEIPAGTPPTARIRAGECAKIFTGSLLPEGADAVVMVERTKGEGGRIHLEGPVQAGQHVRPPGEVVREGETVIPAGVRIGPGHIALLATIGVAHPRCSVRPRVAILPTGSELVAVDAALAPGQVRDSNSLALAAQVLRTGGLPTLLPPVVDDREVLRARIDEALGSHDVLLTSGGVSMGDYDFVGPVLRELGCQVHFDRVRTKPGKPVTFATRGDTQVFGLPGNPVSSMVSFELLARPALRKRMGMTAPGRRMVPVSLASRVSKAADRRDHQRAVVRDGADGLEAVLAGGQGSAMIRGMAEAQVLVVLADDATGFDAGSRVPAIALDEFLEPGPEGTTR